MTAAPPIIVPIRRAIETFALRLIYDSLTADDYAAWRGILARMKEACTNKDYATVAETDIAWHRSILERAGQPDLLAIWSTIVARVRHHFRQSHRTYDDLMDVYREHAAIVDTFRAGDKEAAVAILEQNIA